MSKKQSEDRKTRNDINLPYENTISRYEQVTV
jgi:hypothetical protein